jgi:hypothetical protein
MLLLLLACDPQTKPSDLPSESTPNESAPAQETDPADDSPAESKAHSDDSPHSEDPADTGPIFDDQVEILHITLGTYDNENAGTDERVTVCLNKTDCFVMDNADWNDNEQAAVDVYVTEGLSLSREALGSVTAAHQRRRGPLAARVCRHLLGRGAGALSRRPQRADGE